MEDKPILKKTVYTALVMLATWAVFIGVVSIAAVAITTRAVGAAPVESDDVSAHASDAPAKKVDAPVHPQKPARGGDAKTPTGTQI